MPVHVTFTCTLPVLFVSTSLSLTQVEGTVCGQSWKGGGELALAVVKQYHMALLEILTLCRNFVPAQECTDPHSK